MLNPANPEVQEYELAILKEFAGKYPDVDGIVFDRVRSISPPISVRCRRSFSKLTPERKSPVYPGDILRWTQDADGEVELVAGPLFRKWIRWRASVIKDFVTEAHRQLKEINPPAADRRLYGRMVPDLLRGRQLGQRAVSSARYFDWATPGTEYGLYRPARHHMTGLYYTRWLPKPGRSTRPTEPWGSGTEAGMSDRQITGTASRAAPDGRKSPAAWFP